MEKKSEEKKGKKAFFLRLTGSKNGKKGLYVNASDLTDLKL